MRCKPGYHYQCLPAQNWIRNLFPPEWCHFPARYNLSTGLWNSFSTIPMEFRKKCSFCTILQLSEILQLHSTWTNYHFLHKKGVQSRYLKTRSADLSICSHRSFNRFWTSIYSLKCQNPLYQLWFPTGNPKDHSRTVCLRQESIEGGKQLSKYTKLYLYMVLLLKQTDIQKRTVFTHKQGNLLTAEGSKLDRDMCIWYFKKQWTKTTTAR